MVDPSRAPSLRTVVADGAAARYSSASRHGICGVARSDGAWGTGTELRLGGTAARSWLGSSRRLRALTSEESTDYHEWLKVQWNELGDVDEEGICLQLAGHALETTHSSFVIPSFDARLRLGRGRQRRHPELGRREPRPRRRSHSLEAASPTSTGRFLRRLGRGQWLRPSGRATRRTPQLRTAHSP